METQTTTQKQADIRTQFTTLDETPFALTGSATVAVRTTQWDGKDRSGTYVQLRKSQLKGRGNPAEFTSVTLGGDPAVIEAIGRALVKHAEALRAKA